MKAIREFAGQPLLWVQPRAMKQHFELRCGDEVLAVMQWQSSWRSGATAETAEGSWFYKRQGLRQVMIESNEADLPIPAFSYRWMNSATLDFPDGHTYLWKRGGFWTIKRTWTTTDGVSLVAFKTKYGFMKTGGEAAIAPFAASLPELPLLMTLGWYLMVTEMRAAATASSAVIA